MKRWILVLILSSLCVSAQAQWYRQLGHLKVATPQTADQTAQLTRQAVLQAQLENSLLRIQEKDWLFRLASLEGTGFVIEENYQGKKYLWGVTASHYLFQKPAIKAPQGKTTRVPFEIQGNVATNDISLFLIPENLADFVTPLHLADTPITVGDELYSAGYWNKHIHVDKSRKVQEITKTRVVTSLDIEPETIREGTCGSPVLNQAGEVVGMHCGNSAERQLGYMIPVQNIRNALVAYHQNGLFLEELWFNGIDLGPIAINEQLVEVEVFEKGTSIKRFGVFLRRRNLDYNHLEKLADLTGGDRIIFTLERGPLSTKTPDRKYHERRIIYDVQTGHITLEEGESHSVPRY